MIRSFFYAFIILSVLSSKALASVGKYGVLLEGAHLEQKVQLNIPEPFDPTLTIVYGNANYGFYEITPASASLNPVEVSIVPPGYKFPIDFYVRQKGTLKKLAQKQFSSPFRGEVISLTASPTGRFSFPFLFLTGSFRTPEGIQHIPYITNAQGEVIWAHALNDGNEIFGYHLVFHPIKPGFFGVLSYREQSFFEVVTLFGKTLRRIDPRVAPSPYVLHHDFVVDPDLKTVTTFGHQVADFRNFYPLFSEPLQDTINNVGIAASSPMSLILGTLIEVNLETNVERVIWNPLSYYSPFTTANQFNVPSPYQPGLALSEYQDWVNREGFWGHYRQRAHLDWMHMNSVHRSPDGTKILLSFRNFHELAVLDAKSKTVLWTIGCQSTGSKADFLIKEKKDCFFGQHTAQWIGDDRILLFDNHFSPFLEVSTERSRLAVYRLDYANHLVELEREYVQSTPAKCHSKARGSAYLLRSNNILGFFPDESGFSDYAVEFDFESGTELARMVLPRDNGGSGYRGDPQYSLGKEKFIGWDLNEM